MEPLVAPACFQTEGHPEEVAPQLKTWRHIMGRGILLWLIGVPIPLIIIFLLFFR